MSKRNFSYNFSKLADSYLSGTKPRYILSNDLIDYCANFGLSPLLAQIYLNCDELVSSEQKKRLLAIELTSKYYSASQNSALEEIVKQAHNKNIDIIFLKGIHVANQYYDNSHIRLMSDIDILVEEKYTEELSKILFNLSYIQESDLPDSFYKTHQHLKPFHHLKTNTWVEVHTRIFPKDSSHGSRPIFQPNSLLHEMEPIINYTNNTYSLNPTINLHYTITHWVREFKLSNSLIQLIDIALIINREKIDWEKFITDIKTRDHATEVKLVFWILQSVPNINLPSDVLDRISVKKDSMGRLGRWILNRISIGFLKEQTFITKVIGETNCARIWNAYLRDKGSLSNHLYAISSILSPVANENSLDSENILHRIYKFMVRNVENIKNN